MTLPWFVKRGAKKHENPEACVEIPGVLTFWRPTLAMRPLGNVFLLFVILKTYILERTEIGRVLQGHVGDSQHVVMLTPCHEYWHCSPQRLHFSYYCYLRYIQCANMRFRHQFCIWAIPGGHLAPPRPPCRTRFSSTSLDLRANAFRQ